MRNVILPVPKGGKYFSFNHGLWGTGDGQIIYPEEGHVAMLRPGEGPYFGAVAVEEATTNEYSNPTFNTASSNGGWSHWGQSGHQGSYGQTQDRKCIYGDQPYAHWIANGVGATGNYLVYQSPSLGGNPAIRSLSVICCMEDGSPVTQDKIYPAWNGRNGGAPNNQWTRIEQITGTHFYRCVVEGISQDGTNDLVGVYVRAGYRVYLSQMQLERKLFSTSFTEGSRPEGYLKYAAAAPHNEGTLAFWWRPNIIIGDGSPAQLAYPKIMQIGTYFQDKSFTLWLWNGQIRAMGRINGGWGLNQSFSGANEIQASHWYHVAVTWMNEARDWLFCLNGEQRGSASLSEALAPWNDGGSIKIERSSSFHPNAIYSDLLILPYAASPQEISALYEATTLYDYSTPLLIAL